MYIHVYMRLALLNKRKNEYPLVERFMYLFMVVLQVCIFFPKTPFWLKRIFIWDAFISIFPTPLTNIFFWGNSLIASLSNLVSTSISTAPFRSYVQAYLLHLGVVFVASSHFILRKGIVCHLKFKLVSVKMTNINPEKFPASEENSKNK